MNKRKGLKRLLIAVLVPYFLFWGIVGGLNYNRWLEYEAMAIAAERQQSPDAWYLRRTSNDAAEWWGLAVGYGLVWPLFLLFATAIIGGIGYWVYRGFRPNAD